MNKSYSKIRHIKNSNLFLESRVLTENLKSKCFGSEVDKCIDNKNYNPLSEEIAFGISNACGCLPGKLLYYVTPWDDKKLLTYLEKINSQVIFDEVNKILRCIMEIKNWSDIHKNPLEQIVSSISTKSDLHLKMLRIIKTYQEE